MTEQLPPPSQPEEPYGTEHTGLLPPWETHTTPPPAPRRRNRAGVAGLLVAALVVGGAGGLGGAALYDTNNSSATTTTQSTDTGTTRSASTDSTGRSTTASAVKGTPEAVAAAVLPSVVKIDVVDANGSGGSGSGIILSSDGEILTNNHVVALLQGGGSKMTVSFNDGSTASATVVGKDPVTDLAVIKAQGVSGLVPAKLGNSDALQVGEGVVAIGSPFGLDATVTSGIVSSLNRPVAVGTSTGTSTIYPAIQTDAAINPGNSGGPLVNLAGQVVGIDSSIRTAASSSSGGEGGSIGLGFAIPISNVLPIVDELRSHQTPTHAKLGVTVSDATGSNGLVDGAKIQSIVAGSAADKAGLKTGDVITRVDSHAISGLESLVATIRGYRPGDQVKLTVQRGGSTITLSATLDSDLNQQAS